MEYSRITNLLKKEVLPALGCTGPVAVALAAARAAAEVDGSITSINVALSPGMYKNGWGVAVPGTKERGNALGAAYGAIGGDYRLALEVLSTATSYHLEKALEMVEKGKVKVFCDNTKKGIYIEATVNSAESCATAILEASHDRISKVIKNGEIIYKAFECIDTSQEFDVQLSLSEILDYAEHVVYDDIAFLAEGGVMNRALANDGLKNSYGLNSGRTLMNSYSDLDIIDFPSIKAKIFTCAASDARMGGSQLPAMSTVGSGNQGITAIIPVGVFADHINATEEQRCRALAISHLVTYMVKTYVGRISSTCLCAIASASGSASSIVWMSGGNERQMEYAIMNVVSALAGQICDGAKNACALKMGVACDQAFTAAQLALNGNYAGYYDGLVEEDLEGTLKNLAKLTTNTREIIDTVLTNILNDKSKKETGK